MRKKKASLSIKLGSSVKIIAGKDKGKVGEVTGIFPSKQKVIDKGINTKTKHVKPTQKSESGKLSFFEAPIHYSNVKYEQGEL